jgi:DNA-binding MarR family transcriptional regulator
MTGTDSPAPLLDGRVIGLAPYASRAVLETVLSRHGLGFREFVTLRPVAVADGPLGRDRLTGAVTGALKIDAADVHRLVGNLLRAGLVAADGPERVRVTDAGREVHGRVSAETAAASARIYAGIPRDELAVAGRVLALVTERAEAELAAARG